MANMIKHLIPQHGRCLDEDNLSTIPLLELEAQCPEKVNSWENILPVRKKAASAKAPF
jgi:hypothetical protein